MNPEATEKTPKVTQSSVYPVLQKQQFSIKYNVTWKQN